jgi:GntR family transcriptional regulator/MocR family aminotransferase
MMGTLEGIMYPSLRLSYLVVPQRLIEVFVAMRGLLGDCTNTQLQLALAWFIDEGHLATHLRHLRRIGLERRDVLRTSCARHLPDGCTLGPLDGSLHGSIHLPAGVSDRDVVRRMRAEGVLAVALSSGCIAPRPPPHGNGLAIGYGAFDAFTIERAIAIVGRCIRDSVAAGAGSGTAHQRAGENR